MKKFLKIFVLALIIFPATASAGMVRISDYSVDEFYHAYNTVANTVTKNGWSSNEPPVLGYSGKDFDNYLMIAGANDKSGRDTAIILKANKEGHVAEIIVVTSFKDKTAVQIGADVFKNIIITVGLSEQDGGDLLSDITNGKNPTSRFCFKTQRYILMRADFNNESQIFTIYLAAFVE